MKKDTLARDQEIFERCIAEPPHAWDRILREACGGDEEMEQRVRRLLDHYTPTGMDHSGFMKLEGGDPEYIGPYRILQRLGEGGMGIVYAAEQRAPVRRRVAVKVLRSGVSSREVLARFDVERQALALMSHPNIARILDAGTTADHRPYIVMEFVPGEPITQYAERRDLALPDRLQLFATVCDAVQHAHQRGVIHRDLKPSNILITEEDGSAVPKIIDFGIAKAITQRLTDQTLETKVGSLLGTPDYMSPEQADLSPLDIDTRADIYALGAVLYQLLTGTTPLQLSGTGKSYTDMQQVIREQAPAPPSSRVGGALQRHVRGELDWITLKALEKQRGLRYSSAADFAADIRHHLANETVTAGPPSRLRNVQKFVRRHWFGVAAVLIIMFTLAISQVLLVRKNRELQAERDRANAEAMTAERVTEFLGGIFRASNPQDADTITARELLERGRRQIEQDETLPDDVRLQLLLPLAEAFRSLGLDEDAIPLFRRAKELVEAGASDDPQVEYEILSSLGRALLYARRTGEARAPLEAAVRLADARASVPYQDTINIRIAISSLELDSGNFKRAQSIAAADFADARARFGLESEPALRMGGNLAYIQCMTAEFDAAKKLIDQLLPIAHRREGENGRSAIFLQSTLGIMYTALGQLEDAERAYGPRYAHALEIYGPDAGAVQRLTMLYAQTLSDTDKALTMLEDLVERLQRQYGDDAPLLAEAWDSLGLVHLRIRGHEAVAERYIEQARVQAERLYGSAHMTTRGIYTDVAKVHARAGREESALMFLRKAGDAPIFQFMVARDPDFAVLHDNPEFIRWLGPFADELPG